MTPQETRIKAGDLAANLLTATKAPATKASPVNTEAWAKWAEFELWGNGNTRLQLEEMVRAVAEFCRDVKAGTKPRWLSLVGSSGTGKTYLAKRVWDWYRHSPLFEAKTLREEASGRDEVVYPGQFCWWPAIAGKLAANDGYDQLLELESERFVVFDELGADRDPSGHIRNCLARTLCARVGKWTLVTSNKTVEQIADDIDRRVASRMIRDGNQVVEVDLPDYSIQKLKHPGKPRE